MATHTLLAGDTITASDGKEYTLASNATVDNGVEQRQDAEGKLIFMKNGKEVKEDGSPLKVKKSSK